MSDLKNHAFISYVRDDSELVDKLARDLSKRGVHIWIDRRDISPGARWQDAIRDAIRAGAFFVACFSSRSVARARSYMNEEILLAIEELRLRPVNRAWFLPVKLDHCDIPAYRLGPTETLEAFQHLDLAAN